MRVDRLYLWDIDRSVAANLAEEVRSALAAPIEVVADPGAVIPVREPAPAISS
jgi:hypothetical protein